MKMSRVMDFSRQRLLYLVVSGKSPGEVARGLGSDEEIIFRQLKLVIQELAGISKLEGCSS
jgi:DNA-binding CsgD family transcriptional regulator